MINLKFTIVLCLCLLFLFYFFFKKINKSNNFNDSKLITKNKKNLKNNNILKIIDNTNHIIINENFVTKKNLDILRNKFPDLNNKEKYYLSFIEVGNDLSKKWNIPKDETYFKEGVIVEQTQPPNYFVSKQWMQKIANRLKIDENYLEPLTWKYKRNIKNSNGLWLHTDIRREEKRNILVLIYVGNYSNKKDGGELLIFNEKSKYNKNIPLIKNYQSGYPLKILKNIKINEFINTDSIGGEWNKNKTPTTFQCIHKILPKDGLVVIMDYRDKYNIHAVSPKTNYERNVVEQWFSYSKP